MSCIVGIDPGSRVTGYAVLAVEGGMLCLRESGLITPSLKESFTERLRYIHGVLQKIVATHTPMLVSIEDVHVAQNARTALKLGQARGVVMAVAIAQAVPIFDCTPSMIKKTLTSYGAATKEQVALVVQRYFNVHVKKYDESDAIATALCAYHYAPQFNKLLAQMA